MSQAPDLLRVPEKRRPKSVGKTTAPTEDRNSGGAIEALSNETLMVTHWQDCRGKRRLEEVKSTEKSQLFLSVYVDDIKMVGQEEHWGSTWRNSARRHRPRENQQLITMLQKQESRPVPTNQHHRCDESEEQNKSNSSSQPITAWSHARSCRRVRGSVLRACWEKRLHTRTGGNRAWMMVHVPEVVQLERRLGTNLVHIVLKCLETTRIGRRPCFGRSTCWHDESSSGTRFVPKGWHNLQVTSIKRNITDNTVLLESTFWISIWNYFRTLLLRDNCKIPNQLQAECYAYLDHKHLFHFPGCARSKQPCLTAAQNQK